jgi:RNA-directed DNA polymerase
MAAERENLRTIIAPRMNWMPIRLLIDRINRQTAGWSVYHRYGRSLRYFYQIDTFVLNRLIGHLHRRSQRPYRPPEGTTWYHHLTQHLGWKPLATPPKADR